jgi:hypothetical protein
VGGAGLGEGLSGGGVSARRQTSPATPALSTRRRRTGGGGLAAATQPPAPCKYHVKIPHSSKELRTSKQARRRRGARSMLASPARRHPPPVTPHRPAAPSNLARCGQLKKSLTRKMQNENPSHGKCKTGIPHTENAKLRNGNPLDTFPQPMITISRHGKEDTTDDS